MNIFPTWHPEYLSGVLILSFFIFCYFCYWFISQSARLKSFCRRKYEGEDAQANKILLQRLVGIIFLGAVPVLAVLTVLEGHFSDYGVIRSKLTLTLIWIAGISIVLVPLVIRFSRRPDVFGTYPLIRKKIWNRKLLFLNTLSWIIYLLGYEFFFRGFILFTCIRAFGVFPAIVLNVSLYFSVHIPYGFRVTLGSVLFGFAMCFATIHTGGIWVAFVSHLLVALLNDYVAFSANPETKLVR